MGYHLHHRIVADLLPREAIDGLLSEREYLVLDGLYNKKRRIRDIAPELDVTEARVQQIRDAAVERLYRRSKAKWDKAIYAEYLYARERRLEEYIATLALNGRKLEALEEASPSGGVGMMPGSQPREVNKP